MKKVLIIALAVLLVFAMNSTVFAATGNTDVKFQVADTQISVALPTGGIVATVTASDGTLTFPAAASCTITNGSAFAIKVDSIQCTAETGWTLTADASTATADAIVATVSPDAGTTTVNLVTTSQAASGAVWNMKATGVTGNVLNLTFAGSIKNPGANTQALTTTAAEAFNVVFTVSAGANA